MGFVLSLVNQVLFSYYFGTSAELDAYWLALTLVQIATFYMGPAREAIVPAFSKHLAHKSSDAADYFSQAFNLFVLVLLASVGLLAFVPGVLSALVVDNQQKALYERVVLVAVSVAPLAVLMPMCELFSNLLTAYHRVLTQSVVRIASGVMLALCLVLFATRWGINAAVAGIVAGQVAACVLLLSALAKAGLRYQWRSLPRVDMDFLRLAGALLISYGVSQLYILFDRNTLTLFGEGIVSAYQYATTLANAPQMILIASLTTVIWPRALTAARLRQVQLTEELVRNALNLLTPALGLVMIFGALFAKQIVHVLFFRGAFDERSVTLTSLCFSAAVLALPFVGLSLVVGRVLVSHQAARSLVAVGVGSAVVGVVVIACGRVFHSLEITVLHVPVSALAGAVVSMVALRQILGPTATAELQRQLRVTFTVVLLMNIALWLLYPAPRFELASQVEIALKLIVHGVIFTTIYCSLYIGLAFVVRRLTRSAD